MEMIFEIYIKTSPEKLWTALTDPRQTSVYYFGNEYNSDWVKGSPFTTTNANADGPLGSGTVLDVEEPVRLVLSLNALWNESVRAEGESRVTFEIEQIQDTCLLKITHDRLKAGANQQLYGGWPMILSGLKTWLETGERLTTPGSLMYS